MNKRDFKLGRQQKHLHGNVDHMPWEGLATTKAQQIRQKEFHSTMILVKPNLDEFPKTSSQCNHFTDLRPVGPKKSNMHLFILSLIMPPTPEGPGLSSKNQSKFVLGSQKEQTTMQQIGA
eukprot:TRINITY_DN2322_c0_g2_i10.p4 TRINITY_DN2322_c0_g2~~TRINITY_DN2322_c0_g2_i10.p4  ORF type:complete len:120 (-),score=8.41 TRINITY_DN2322_c0_g2_i10:456-815(-)